MSASGYSDPRLSRPDPSDTRGLQLSGAIQTARASAGAGIHSTGGFSGTALSVRRARRGAAASGHPYKVSRATPEAGAAGADQPGWISVTLDSTLLASARPDDRITITGLDSPFRLVGAARQYVWLEVDLRGLYATPPTAILAKIDHGEDWNGDDGDFFPHPVRFDTDDGTSQGSGDTAPVNRKQTHFYVPLAYTYDYTQEQSDGELFGGFDPSGIDIPLGTDPGSHAVRLVQQNFSHLRIYKDCDLGDVVTLAAPWHASFPPPVP